MKYIIVTLFIMRLSAEVGECQGTFQNLGFESATIVSAELPYTVQFSTAFPGWTGSVRGAPVNLAVYNTYAISSSEVVIFDSQTDMKSHLISGKYTALLEAGFGGDTTLSQTGAIPAGALPCASRHRRMAILMCL